MSCLGGSVLSTYNWLFFVILVLCVEPKGKFFFVSIREEMRKERWGFLFSSEALSTSSRARKRHLND